MSSMTRSWYPFCRLRGPNYRLCKGVSQRVDGIKSIWEISCTLKKQK